MRTRLTLIRADSDDVIVLDTIGVKHRCVEAAAHHRGEPIPLDLVDLVDRRGDVVPRSEWPVCPVDLSDPWAQRVHGWTHR